MSHPRKCLNQINDMAQQASLCGHYEVVQLLLESGALCDRDTFQGERCLYNALTDQIRKLLSSYDYSKSADPLQPLASHITSLLSREEPHTSDIIVTSSNQSFNLHKFVLSARSPYFREKLNKAPSTTSYKLTAKIPPQAFGIAIRYLYFGETPNDVGGGPGTGFTEGEVLEGIDKLTKQLEIRSLWEGILENDDRRLARQHRTDEVEKGRDQLEVWFKENVVRHKIVIDAVKAVDVKWDRENTIFADVLLKADELLEENAEGNFSNDTNELPSTNEPKTNGIPVGPTSQFNRFPPSTHSAQDSTLFPAHRAMLIRSEYFQIMFSSAFLEAQHTPHLQIINVDCSPEVLQIILTYLYTEKSDIPLDLAVEVLYAADLLLIEKLKAKAAVVISTLGNGPIHSPSPSSSSSGTPLEEPIDIFQVLRAGWATRVPRLESFAAKYFADRLEIYIDDPAFANLIRESAARIQKRQETDSIELLDDIRHYLSERFRMRFEDAGLEELMDENAATGAAGGGEEEEGKGASVDADVATADVGKGAGGDLPPEVTIRTLDGEIASDELAADAMNYQILLGKIDALLERLRLDA